MSNIPMISLSHFGIDLLKNYSVPEFTFVCMSKKQYGGGGGKSRKDYTVKGVKGSISNKEFSYFLNAKEEEEEKKGDEGEEKEDEGEEDEGEDEEEEYYSSREDSDSDSDSDLSEKSEDSKSSEKSKDSEKSEEDEILVKKR